MTDEISSREYLEKIIELNDKRYAEVAIEREKALNIKEVEREKALSLARDIQVYKDEKANELRSQIERERGSYATQNDLKSVVDKIEATIKPLIEYSSAQRGKAIGLNSGWGYIVSAIMVVGVVITLVLALGGT